MEYAAITKDNTVFIVLSFEGPDRYSMAGGLGTRVTNLSWNLAGMGYPTHLFFVGDAKAKGEERVGEKLTLHRWCQWISEYFPLGVYQGEDEKINDFNKSIPPYIIDQIAKPAISQGKMIVVLSEEWHTAETVCRFGEQLTTSGISDKVISFWNANNTFGFDRIDWPRLAKSSVLTTVSRYMKHIMREKGVNPLVIPNGIPETLLDGVDIKTADKVRNRINSEFLLTKVARYDTTKGWNEALEATARLKNQGFKTKLIARGGIESYGGEVLYNAKQMGLKVQDVTADRSNVADYLKAIVDQDEVDVINVLFQCPLELLQILYRASDAVLANSTHEPFGLVGLETMAAGGVAFTGGTGEDYADHMHNAVVLETSDPREIESYVTYLDNHEQKAVEIRNSARETASSFTWAEVIKGLVSRLENQATIQGIMSTAIGNFYSAPETIPMALS